MSIMDELSAAGFTAEQTMEAAERAPGALGQKLADLALVMGAFHAAIGPEHSDASDRLSELLRRLPERERQVIALRFYHGLTQQRAAELLHISQVQVSRLERRAVERLRELLS